MNIQKLDHSKQSQDEKGPEFNNQIEIHELPKGDIYKNERFMCLIVMIQDLQDGTKFSKLVTCEDSFIKLLNLLTGENKYALTKDRDQMIDFTLLNESFVQIIGLYGSQRMA